MSVAVDHLVLAAASLEQGVAWCISTLGITPGPGGKHALMGSHNRLFKIATEVYPKAYFEIIAIDPAAPPPGRPRWFGLDDPALQARLIEAPRLIHMVARTTKLDRDYLALVEAGLQPGQPISASRQTPAGLLAWQILVREDGRLECGGALPTLIQWPGLHPADAMPESGVTLRALALQGVPEGAHDVLRLRGVSVAAASGPALTVTLTTPLGTVVLSSG